jgi:hypothetical protein
VKISFLIAALISFLTTPQAMAFLSPERDIPAKIEIVRVRAEKEYVRCEANLPQDVVRIVAASACSSAICNLSLGGIAGTTKALAAEPAPAPKPMKNIPLPKVNPRARRSGRLKKFEEALVTRYYGENAEGEVKIVATESTACIKGSVVYRKTKGIDVPLELASTPAFLAEMQNFHRGCSIKLALARTRVMRFEGYCPKLESRVDENGSAANQDTPISGAN